MHEETLIVRHFLNLESINLTLRPFTIIIGPQSSGKSILTKLLYCARRSAFDVLDGAIAGRNKKAIDKQITERLCRTFPIDTWGENQFYIEYINGGMHFTFSRHQSKSSIRVNYGEQVKKLLNAIRRRTKSQPYEDDELDISSSLSQRRELRHFAFDRMTYFLGESSRNRAIFVPAGRSYYSAMKEGVWELISKSINLDPIYTDFGTEYERMKSFWERTPFMRDQPSLRSFEKRLEALIQGKIVREMERDYVYTRDGRRVPFTNASSGQQECIPLLIALRTVAFSSRLPFSLYIEEPEAHLYPTAQRDLVFLMAECLGRMSKGSQLVVTTHSPYVLATMNLLLLSAMCPPERRKNLATSIGKSKLENDDVQAYHVSSGKLESIMDPDTGLVDAHFIDSVSSEISDQTDQLIELIYKNEN